VIDGKINPKEWDSASYLQDFRDRVTGNAPAKDPTAAYIGYTNEAIYVAFKCFDSEPAKIIGREIQPNSEFRGEDRVTLSFNLFGTRAFDQLNEFIVNAIGTQTERIAGGRSNKREWRGEWQAATSQDEEGWTCEIRIPWNILNYPDKKLLNVDLNLIRQQGRSLFEQSWANYRLNPLPELQGIWSGVRPPPPPKAKPQFQVYSAADYNDGTIQNRIGADAKLQLTSSFSALASVAPDFRNIEDVIAGNDFVRVERFLNDPRPFFLEGSNFFELNERFSFGRMFYSRRIQDFDFGAKAFGLLDPKLAVGAMATQSGNGDRALVFKALNTISGTQNQKFYVTNSVIQGEENTAAGFGFFKRWNTIGFSVDAAAEQASKEDWDSAGTVQLNYIRPTTFASIRYLWVENDFNPRLAFIPWTNRRGAYGVVRVNREWRTGPFRDYSFFANINNFRTYDTNELQEGGWNFNADVSTRNDFGIGISANRSTFFGRLDDIKGINFTLNKTNRFRRINFAYEDGIRNDLPSNYYALDTSWRIGNNFDIGFRQSVLEFNGTDQQSIFTAVWQQSADTTLSTRIASTPGGTNAYFSYRKAGLAGTEYYVILGDPNALTTQSRLALKLVWAF
jgi:hypothetical protein